MAQRIGKAIRRDAVVSKARVYCDVNVQRPREARDALHTAVDRAISSVGGALYTHAALAEAKARFDATREEERAAFAAAVSDWRKRGTGPVEIEREFEQKLTVGE